MSLFKAASTVSLLTLASRITGLARELLIASTFGASAMTDAFNVAFRIPNLFRRLFAEGAFSQAFVPILAAHKQTHGDEATRGLIDRVASALTAALLLTCAFGVVAAPVLVYAMASGLKQDARGFEAAVFMTRWMFPYIGFMSLVALASGVLNTWRRFAVPAATPVLLNVAMIAAAWFGAPYFKAHGIEPIYALAVGVMLGGALQLGVQLWALAKLGLLPKIRLNRAAAQSIRADAATKNVAKMMLPALLGVSVAQISLLINTQIASHLAVGSVSWLSYADRLMEFPVALLGVALGVVLVPSLSSAQAAGDKAKYSAMLDWGLRLVLLLAVPSSAALLCFSEPLVATLFHYGAFSAKDVAQTTAALTGYGAGLLGLVAIKVLAPGFYARGDVKTPMQIAVVVLVATQLLNLLLVPRMAHAGLALSIGLGALLNAAWLLGGLIRRGAFEPSAGWGVFAAQVGGASALLASFLLWAAGSVNWLALQAAVWQRIGLLALVLLAAAAIYFVALRLSGLHLGRLFKR